MNFQTGNFSETSGMNYIQHMSVSNNAHVNFHMYGFPFNPSHGPHSTGNLGTTPFATSGAPRNIPPTGPPQNVPSPNVWHSVAPTNIPSPYTTPPPAPASTNNVSFSPRDFWTQFSRNPTPSNVYVMVIPDHVPLTNFNPTVAPSSNTVPQSGNLTGCPANAPSPQNILPQATSANGYSNPWLNNSANSQAQQLTQNSQQSQQSPAEVGYLYYQPESSVFGNGTGFSWSSDNHSTAGAESSPRNNTSSIPPSTLDSAPSLVNSEEKLGRADHTASAEGMTENSPYIVDEPLSQPTIEVRVDSSDANSSTENPCNTPKTRSTVVKNMLYSVQQKPMKRKRTGLNLNSRNPQSVSPSTHNQLKKNASDPVPPSDEGEINTNSEGNLMLGLTPRKKDSSVRRKLF